MPAKPKGLSEVQFLALLDKVLAKVMSDLTVRSKIQEEVAKEIRLIRNLASFTKFAEDATVPDAAPATVADLQDQIAATFGDDAKVSVTPADEDGGNLAVEITLPDDRTVSSQIRVGPGGEAENDNGESQAPFVPFPVTLPTDPESVWMLARREDFGPDEAGRALASIQEEYWASKAGQQRLRKGAERNFAEFVENVSSAALLESGMKRHYKISEKIHALHQLNQGGGQPAASKPKAVDNSLDHLFAPAGENPGKADEGDDGPSWNA